MLGKGEGCGGSASGQSGLNRISESGGGKVVPVLSVEVKAGLNKLRFREEEAEFGMPCKVDASSGVMRL